MSVSTPTRITYSLLEKTGTSAAAATNAAKRAFGGTRSNVRYSRLRSRRSSTSATQLSTPMRGCSVIPSYLLDVCFPEQPGGADDQNGDQDPEDEKVVEPRRDVALRERLGEPDHDSAEHRAGNAPDAADDRRREALEPGDEAHEVVDALEHEADHDTRRAGERRADEESHDDDAVDVD